MSPAIRPTGGYWKDGSGAVGAVPLIPGLNTRESAVLDYSEALAAAKVDGTGVTQIVVMNQAAYDAVVTKSTTTLYIVDGSIYIGTVVLGTGDALITSALANYIPSSQKAAANGVATLGTGGRVPLAQLGTGTPDSTKVLSGSGDWVSGIGGVQSVNGRTPDANGVVNLTPTDLGIDATGSSSGPITDSILVQKGTLVVGANKLPPGMLFPTATTLTRIDALVGTAPTGAGVIIALNQGGSTLLTITIAAGQTKATTVQAVGSGVALTAGVPVTFDITQIGSTVAGADLLVAVTTDASATSQALTLAFGTPGDADWTSTVWDTKFGQNNSQVAYTIPSTGVGRVTAAVSGQAGARRRIKPASSPDLTTDFELSGAVMLDLYNPATTTDGALKIMGRYNGMTAVPGTGTWLAMSFEWNSANANFDVRLRKEDTSYNYNGLQIGASYALADPGTTWVLFRWRVVGNSLRFRTWLEGNTEPSTWNMDLDISHLWDLPFGNLGVGMTQSINARADIKDVRVATLSTRGALPTTITQPTVVASGTVDAGSGATRTVTPPAGAQTGDLLLSICRVGSTSASMTAPAGHSPQGLPFTVFSGSVHKEQVFAGVLGANPQATLTFSTDAASIQGFLWIIVRNWRTFFPLLARANGTGTGQFTNTTANTFTPAEDNSLLVMFYAADASATVTTPAGMAAATNSNYVVSIFTLGLGVGTGGVSTGAKTITADTNRWINSGGFIIAGARS